MCVSLQKTYYMTKRQIYDKIAEVTAEVCDVSVDDIHNGCRKEDVVTARTICIFWADAAGFSVESLLKCMDCNNANSINSVKARIEQMWIERFAFHMLIIEVGKRLLNYARSIEEEFDVFLPINKLRRITNKY